MDIKISLDNAYAVSEDVVAREIEGEIIIVPLVAGIGDMEDELYTLNETGKAVWERLDGQKVLREVVEDLSSQFEASAKDIREDVTGFVAELVKRKILVEVSEA
ncbi:MAG: PqqD family protein [Deltaproteobacteria bacterium]|nr:PqqD family protein [Deltaproteobacteria bacterium]MBW1737205.1 PqqD family protein [Deltaproteobacteria bacterium]MBW1910459.1 PqqD family protein [Deltaproteobacteria bacterium]MBW2034219.1 PqqD family protein [Deltaproteobacteria bacterium]MBW2114850.1 PqqD family protein [Deltaproteobacteria bacterium]